MDINIEELIKLLPEGYQQACYETKAIERKHTVQTLEELLVMCLYYIYGASCMELIILVFSVLFFLCQVT
jgi:hypothetical protein